ncbi:MAG: hypothetical protein PWQ26_558, partial [Thermotoga sp.]|nr:hypothetical protein [Thermotoga sp.]
MRRHPFEITDKGIVIHPSEGGEEK